MPQGSQKPLWPCPACGRAFANASQSHACGRYDLERHFAGKPPLVREIYEAFLAMLEATGPVTVLPEKSRIAFQARMSFAQLTVRRRRVLGHLILARRAGSRRSRPATTSTISGWTRRTRWNGSGTMRGRHRR